MDEYIASLIITKFLKTYRWNTDRVKQSLTNILTYIDEDTDPYTNEFITATKYIIHNCTNKQFNKGILPLFINFTCIEGQGLSIIEPVPFNISWECCSPEIINKKNSRIFYSNLIMNYINYCNLKELDNLFCNYSSNNNIGFCLLSIIN